MIAGLLIGCLIAQASPRAATRYDPRLRFRTITTPHFAIHFHQGEDALARRLARIAEAEHARLTVLLGHVPRDRTHVVLVDQSDEPNGWATPVPYNLIEIAATQPAGGSLIGNTDDWLRLVFAHEYTHILHLDRSRGWAAVPRAVLGRSPLAFPNLTLPMFLVEGIATWAESGAGDGRVHAGDFHQIVATAARQDAFAPLDRVSGGLVDWPGGYGWYAYGAFFHEYLAERFGPERLGALTAETAGRLPWLGTRAFREVFGASLGELWDAFEAHERARARPAQHRAAAPVRRLTAHGFVVQAPRLDPDGALIYTTADPHGFPRIMRLPPGSTSPERLAERTGGDHVSPFGGGIVYDQPEIVRNAALVSDLYVLDPRAKSVRRLTREARLVEPDVSPDGRRLAAIAIRPGRRSLVVLDLPALLRAPDPLDADAADRAVVLGEAGVAYATPRWSPDGTRIVLERRALAGPSSVVLVVPGAAEQAAPRPRVLATSQDGRVVDPAWSPDGRSILLAIAGRGEPFDIYRVPLDGLAGGTSTLERLTRIPGGARAPIETADGELVFVGYTTEGYDLFRTTVAAGGRADLAEAASRAQEIAAEDTPLRDTPYSPWRTLAPRAWSPILEWEDEEVRVGGYTAGQDALGRHAWSAQLTWLVTRDAALSTVTPGARPDFSVGYVYDRWRPVLFARISEDTTPLVAPRRDGSARPVSLRERAVEAGVYLPVRRIRRTHTLFGSWRVDRTEIAGPEDDRLLRRSGGRLGWAYGSAQQFGFSISPERGLAASVSTELTREVFGADGNATFTRADLRAYLPVGPPHAVLALRTSGATSRGDDRVARMLRLGGHAGDLALLSFDEEASSLLRGFHANQFFGRHLVLVNAEYRFPLTWVGRGFGTWPAFVRALHGAAFLDAGHAWTEAFRGADRKLSYGLELSSDVVLGYGFPLTVTGGVGWGRDGAGEVPDDRQIYVRVGRSF